VTDARLDLSRLPDLSQSALLRQVAADLWEDSGVRALWLGGSLARDAGDEDSDVDLRVAVMPDAFDPARLPDAAHRLARRAAVHLPFAWGEGAVLHHLLLDDGAISDLFVQTTERDPSEEHRLILGCRDAVFAAKLAGGSDPPSPTFPPADPAAARDILLGLWINQMKHIKVLRRGLHLAAWEGEHRMRQDLLRVCFILATGCDCGDLRRMTIHTITPVVRTIQVHLGEEALALVGGPLGTAGEIVEGIARSQDAISRVGRQLSGRLGFDYPDEAEVTVRRCWAAFTAS
jgi:predicted nucleotidyltransferase